MELSRNSLHKLIASISFLQRFLSNQNQCEWCIRVTIPRQATQDLEVFVTNDLKVGVPFSPRGVADALVARRCALSNRSIGTVVRASMKRRMEDSVQSTKLRTPYQRRNLHAGAVRVILRRFGDLVASAISAIPVRR